MFFVNYSHLKSGLNEIFSTNRIRNPDSFSDLKCYNHFLVNNDISVFGLSVITKRIF